MSYLCIPKKYKVVFKGSSQDSFLCLVIPPNSWAMKKAIWKGTLPTYSRGPTLTSSWWFQPHLKNMLVKFCSSSPKFRGENKKSLKPPPRHGYLTTLQVLGWFLVKHTPTLPVGDLRPLPWHRFFQEPQFRVSRLPQVVESWNLSEVETMLIYPWDSNHHENNGVLISPPLLNPKGFNQSKLGKNHYFNAGGSPVYTLPKFNILLMVQKSGEHQLRER